MKFLNYKMPLLLSTIIFVVGCGGDDDKNTKKKNITITQTPQVEYLGIAKKIKSKISLGNTPKDVYLLLSNYSDKSGTVEIQQSNKVAKQKEITTVVATSKKIHAPKFVEDFRANIHKHLMKKNNEIMVSKKSSTKSEKQSTVKAFYLDTSITDATLKKVVTSGTSYGTKRLNIWVSNDSFGNCPKSKCVTQDMVNILANIFLKAGGDNDIYDWVTNIYGAEWGPNSYDNLIAQNNDITILLTDIDQDNSTQGGVIGYFHPKDNFLRSTASNSNESIMLYIDSVLFANGTGTWSIDDYWPKEIVSTMAHEFQHLIHFYQKTVLVTNDATDVWINEMLSESTEDLVASKIRHIGPRGVPYTLGSAGDPANNKGRYPLFNAKNNQSLTIWSSKLENYSTVNAFGAFLLRNYGGAQVLHDILHNNYLDEQSVVHAVHNTPQGSNKTFNDLLKEWGVAVLLSDNTNLEGLPRYNAGGYIPNGYNGSVYQLGSINFFNYSPQPNLNTSVGLIQSQGNYYYKVGTKLSGDIEISVSLPENTDATLIVK